MSELPSALDIATSALLPESMFASSYLVAALYRLFAAPHEPTLKPFRLARPGSLPVPRANRPELCALPQFSKSLPYAQPPPSGASSPTSVTHTKPSGVPESSEIDTELSASPSGVNPTLQDTPALSALRAKRIEMGVENHRLSSRTVGYASAPPSTEGSTVLYLRASLAAVSAALEAERTRTRYLQSQLDFLNGHSISPRPSAKLLDASTLSGNKNQPSDWVREGHRRPEIERVFHAGDEKASAYNVRKRIRAHPRHVPRSVSFDTLLSDGADSRPLRSSRVMCHELLCPATGVPSLHRIVGLPGVHRHMHARTTSSCSKLTETCQKDVPATNGSSVTTLKSILRTHRMRRTDVRELPTCDAPSTATGTQRRELVTFQLPPVIIG